MDDIIAAARACRFCADRMLFPPRPVFQLDPKATIVIVSQAPGRKVFETGIPFNDASGQRLRSWLGVTSAQFYDPTRFAILPVGLCYPGSGASGDLPPRPECAPMWHARLLAQLQGPKLMLVMGKHAMDWHLPAAGSLTDAVWQADVSQAAVVPLPHPSPANNRWFARHPWFEHERVPLLQQRVRRLLAEPS